ncbi:hypothetical protein [Collinsella ihumii]|uniref:hypothetical protein n=1 Tax=Collinsella ihumii TaxID=1720204 RepID=UPI0025AA3A35|nr:hypothetical protein [Collinsella ihumii]MDN0055792.1 hypothetical protein [Collinsella ihumii]
MSRMNVMGRVFVLMCLVVGCFAVAFPTASYAIDQRAISQPRGHADNPFYFYFDLMDVTEEDQPQSKEDNSSAYVYLDHVYIDEAWLYVDGRNQYGEYVNCMGGANAVVNRGTRLGAWRIRQLVYERFSDYGAMALLTGWGQGNPGTVDGVWSSDCYMEQNYEPLNGYPNPNIWD